MKVKKKSALQEYFSALAMQNSLTTYHYKVLLLLNVQPYTQAQLSNMLDIQRQNINRVVKDLEQMKLIEVDRIEGRNKFLKAVEYKQAVKNATDIITKNQLTLFDE